MAPRRTIRYIALGAALFAWCIAIVSGAFVMLGYASTPGADAQAPREWPSDSRLERDAEAFTLLFFAHPHCPCTDASFEALLHVLGAARKPVECQAIFTIPKGTSEGWEESSLLRQVEGVKQITVYRDRFAAETRRFGVATSGHVLLYEPGGRLVFSGGITPSRGHQGDSIGSQTVIEYLSGLEPSNTYVPVFGCPLLNEARSGARQCCPEAAP